MEFIPPVVGRNRPAITHLRWWMGYIVCPVFQPRQYLCIVCLMCDPASVAQPSRLWNDAVVPPSPKMNAKYPVNQFISNLYLKRYITPITGINWKQTIINKQKIYCDFLNNYIIIYISDYIMFNNPRSFDNIIN